MLDNTDERKVSFVIDTRENNRVSQYYTRKGDTVRKAKQLNCWYKSEHPYKAVVGFVTIVEDINENKDS